MLANLPIEEVPDSGDAIEYAAELDFLYDPHRYKVAYGGRGGTKSWGFARALLYLGTRTPLRILCAREVQNSIKDSVHQLLADQIRLLGYDGFYQVLGNEIRGLNGTKFIYTGLSTLTVASIKSFEGVDICWVEEAQSVTRRSWDILAPTIRKDGSEIWVSFNPDLDTDETWVRFVVNQPDDAVVVKVGYETNPWFPGVLDKERRSFLNMVETGARSQEDYDNVWGGENKPAVEGAIYPKEVAKTLADGRLCDVPYDPMLKVHLIWDLGWNDSMVIGFVQVAAGSIRFIDCIEDSHRTYDSYYQEILSKQYNLAQCWLPHDGKAKNPQTGKSPIELLRKLGLTVNENGVPDIGIKPGINAARQMFSRCYFDKNRCSDMFNKLRRYARVISPTTGEAGLPKKDGNDHVADMFRYTAVIEKELTNEVYKRKPLKIDARGRV